MTKGRGGHILATVLFTDIVDSSRLARELGDRRWRILLDRHHAVVRKTLKRWRGREIDNAGDGFFAAFDDQVDAIRCACAVSDDVRELGIDIRAGCHVGQAEIIGKKLGGLTVHAGARVMSLADPCEVLVSRTLKDLVPASGFGFTDRGVHELKGIEGAWHLFAVSTVDGAPRLGPLDPEEARRLLEAIEPLPLQQRRWGKIVIAVVAAALAASGTFLFIHRPRPVHVRAESLVRIDPATNEVVADVPVSKPGAAQLAIVPPHEIWVLSQPEQLITIVDAESERAVGRVPLQSGQATSQLTGFGLVYGWGKVWVAPRESFTTILEFDPHFRSVDRTLDVPGSTGRLGTGDGLLWVPVARAGRWRLAGIDPDTGTVQVKVETALGGYNVGYGEGHAWVTNHDDSSLEKIDPETGTTTTIDLGGVGQPSGIGFGFQSVWISDPLTGVVYRIDPATDEIVDTIQLFKIGTGYQSDVVAFDGSIWVAGPNTNSIVRIDPSTDKVVARIRLPFAPLDLVVGYGSVWATVTAYPS
ncbi:MAG: adenylate/guanylate cyclase domain-containing protein [Actinomycetota bacterium]